MLPELYNCTSLALRIIQLFQTTDKLTKALPEIEEIAKLLPDMDKIGENFAFLKSLLSSGKLMRHYLLCILSPDDEPLSVV